MALGKRAGTYGSAGGLPVGLSHRRDRIQDAVVEKGRADAPLLQGAGCLRRGVGQATHTGARDCHTPGGKRLAETSAGIPAAGKERLTMNAIGANYDLPPDLRKCLDRATRLVWISIAFMVSIIVLMAVVMGSSEAMKAIWVEDTLSLIPLVSFLVGAHYRSKPPDEAYPYGYRGAVLVAFLCGAIALSGFGLSMLADPLSPLSESP